MPTPVANNVRAEMARRRLNQGDLAKVLGVTPPAISDRPRGVTAFKERDIVLLAAFFGMTPGDLFLERAS